MKIEPWCTGKAVYPTKAKAIERIERQRKSKRRRRDSFNVVLQPYLCPSCGQWHVGGTGKAANATDAMGRTIRKKWPTPPKVRDHGPAQ